MQYSCFCSRGIAGSFLWPGCVAIAKVMSKLSSQSLYSPVSSWHSLGWSRSAQRWGTFRAMPSARGQLGARRGAQGDLAACTHLDSNTAQPSPGPQAFAVSLYHVAPKPWQKPALLRSVAKLPVTLMRPRFQPGKLLSSAILTAIAQSAKRWKSLCDFPLHVPSSPAN